MTDRLLRRADIAAMLGTSPGVAASILAERGVHPIDFGFGRSRGPRWLESAVRQTMLDMHQAAQPKVKERRPAKQTNAPAVSLTNMSINDIYQLTQGPCVQ
ncbi:hypothetical protein [Desulfovibrio sp. SGI.169]|uniref:hypothetical protein n=1 Tax=Desulfovibrio sp. SGI.169 TaxID=3420561 RepID=UPI003D0148A0